MGLNGCVCVCVLVRVCGCECVCMNVRVLGRYKGGYGCVYERQNIGLREQDYPWGLCVSVCLCIRLSILLCMCVLAQVCFLMYEVVDVMCARSHL